jgi:hypothetical protein
MRRSIGVAAFVVALVAMVCVDCFNAPNADGWTDLGRAPHLAAMVRKAPSALAAPRTTRALRVGMSASMQLAVALALLGVLETLGFRYLQPDPQPLLRSRGPPVLVT